MDELFEAMHLKDKDPRKKVPLVLADKAFFDEFYQRLIGMETFSRRKDGYPLLRRPHDELVTVLDAPQEVVEYVRGVKQEQRANNKLISMDEGRLNRMISELWKTENRFRQAKVGPAVSIIGGQYVSDKSRVYAEAEELSRKLAENVPALMYKSNYNISQAVISGAQRAAGNSKAQLVSLAVPDDAVLSLSANRLSERYPDGDLRLGFTDYFTQKLVLIQKSLGMVFFPGSTGTLDLFYEALTLIQTGKIPPMPIILVGEKFWMPWHHYHKNILLDTYQTISPQDLDIYTIVDSADEAFEILSRFAAKPAIARSATKEDRWRTLWKHVQESYGTVENTSASSAVQDRQDILNTIVRYGETVFEDTTRKRLPEDKEFIAVLGIEKDAFLLQGIWQKEGKR